MADEYRVEVKHLGTDAHDQRSHGNRKGALPRARVGRAPIAPTKQSAGSYGAVQAKIDVADDDEWQGTSEQVAAVMAEYADGRPGTKTYQAAEARKDEVLADELRKLG